LKEDNFNQESFSDHRILVKSSFYSFLSIYGNFFFNLIITILIARLISPEAWTVLIIANSYMLIITLILTFFPPGLQQTLRYYIPRYQSLNQTQNLKSLLKTAFITKILFLIPIFLISLIIFYFFQNIFLINLNPEDIDLLFLLSPLIIIYGLELFLNSFNEGLNNYKFIFLLLVLKNVLYIGLLLSYIIIIGNLELENIAIFNVVSYAIAFFINLLYVFKKYLSIKVNNKTPIFHNEEFKKILKYGTPVRGGRFLTEIWGEIQIQSIGTLEPLYTTGFYLARTYLAVSTNALNSFASPLTVSFSGFIAKDEKEKIKSMYNLILKYSLFTFLTLTGILFLTTDFFLYILGEDYLKFSVILKIYLFSYLFLIFAAPFDALMLAEHKPKRILNIRILGFLLRLPLFLILLVSFGMIHALIGIIISNSVFGFFYLFFTIKFGKLHINLKPLIVLYMTFALSLILVLTFQMLFLEDFEILLLDFLQLSILKNFYPLSILTFFGIFTFFNLILKMITVQDIENLRSIFHKQKFLNKVLLKILNLLKKIHR
jgi:O-antigen/teichoic acid export membrane protein